MSESEINRMLEVITPEIYGRFKQAVELRKWPSGMPLTTEQVNTCLQAIIAFEHQHLPETQRTGYVPPKSQPCSDDGHIHTHEAPIKWRS